MNLKTIRDSFWVASITQRPKTVFRRSA
jgi:hypothetical protein